jgi:hypothetical protein
MNETQFVAFCAAMAASFVWMFGMRTRRRATRVLGAVEFIGAWSIFCLLERT